MILFAVNANSIFSDFLEETKVGNNFEEALRLNYFQNDIVDEDYQTFTRLRVKATSVNDQDVDFSFAMYGIDPDNNLKLLIDNNIENNQLLNDGIIISEYLSYNENIFVGDTIDFNVKGTEYSYVVVGINNELIENNAFMLKEDLNLSYNLDNTYYNGIYTDDLLYQSTNIEARISYSNALDEIASTLRASTNIVNFILILSTILSLFMFGFIITNYLSDNRLNISILKSIGYNNKEINQKYLLAIVLSFIIAFVSAIPTTTFIFDLLLRNIINQLGYILVLNVSFTNIVISFVTLVVIFVVTIYIINQYYKKISIIEILKSNIK
jgi:putative ABC transport system permease protein